MTRIFVSYKRDVQPDQSLARSIATAFSESDCVFVDSDIAPGERWEDRIEQQLELAQLFVVLVSRHSITSDMVREEVRTAVGSSRARHRPLVLPIRIGAIPKLPYELGALLGALQHITWSSDEDTPAVLEGIRRAANTLAAESSDRTSQPSGQSPQSTAQEASTAESTPAAGAGPARIRENGPGSRSSTQDAPPWTTSPPPQLVPLPPSLVPEPNAPAAKRPTPSAKRALLATLAVGLGASSVGGYIYYFGDHKPSPRQPPPGRTPVDEVSALLPVTSAFVVGRLLIAAAGQVPDRVPSTLTNIMLLAQLIADAKVEKMDEADRDWIDAFFTATSPLGFANKGTGIGTTMVQPIQRHVPLAFAMFRAAVVSALSKTVSRDIVRLRLIPLLDAVDLLPKNEAARKRLTEHLVQGSTSFRTGLVLCQYVPPQKLVASLTLLALPMAASTAAEQRASYVTSTLSVSVAFLDAISSDVTHKLGNRFAANVIPVFIS